VFADVLRSVDVDLVLVGPKLSADLESLARELGVLDKVIVVEKPTNEVLEALYNSALVFLFPSRFEGFGWPLVEAQACGCPIVCSRCPPFREIVSDAVLSRAVDDEEGFAADIVRLARESQEWTASRCAGLQNAERFRPDKMIAEYIALYMEVISNRC
jgi:glycosyltransferase involved in cell wall biosynthesis